MLHPALIQKFTFLGGFSGILQSRKRSDLRVYFEVFSAVPAEAAAAASSIDSSSGGEADAAFCYFLSENAVEATLCSVRFPAQPATQPAAAAAVAPAAVCAANATTRFGFF